MNPLISIQITAYNAENTIGETLRSATSQTWERKEIIVVDDGSTDRTAEIANGFTGVTVVSTENCGLSAAQNRAFEHSQGAYIQYLDADDILVPDKIERQIRALPDGSSSGKLLSSSWAPFFFRTRKARFVQNSLCQDLSPVEWLLRKLGENLHMQNATWLVNRELIEKAGPWDSSLSYDQDGEFFSRVLLASEGTCFVPGTGVYYRASGPSSISVIGESDKKKDSLVASMRAHIKYIRSLEDSVRVRKACLVYLQNWYHNVFRSRPELASELEFMASELGGCLYAPKLRWKYAWLATVFGYEFAYRTQSVMPQKKAAILRNIDKMLYTIQRRYPV